MSISIPSRFYDYVLYYECGSNEKSNPSLWLNIGSVSPGALLNGVKWNSTGNNVGDGAGITRFGITPAAITAYKQWSGNNSYVLNSSNSWTQIVNYFWKQSYSDQAANVACACILCQGKWAGWSSTSLSNLCNELRNKCNNKNQASKIKGSSYSAISALTHCFDNPMDAFLLIRSYRIAYLRSCSNASKFANGWMRREFFAMQSDGLYCEPGSSKFTKYGFTPIPNMETIAAQLKKDTSSGYTKLLDWGETPSSDDILNNVNDGSVNNNVIGDIFSNNTIGKSSSVPNYITGGIFTQGLNSNNKQKGMVVGITINSK